MFQRCRNARELSSNKSISTENTYQLQDYRSHPQWRILAGHLIKPLVWTSSVMVQTKIKHPPDRIERMHISSVLFLPDIHNQILIMRKLYTKPDGGTFYSRIPPRLLKISKSSKSWKDKSTVTDYRRLSARGDSEPDPLS